MNQSLPLVEKANSLILSNSLNPKAKALLLFRLCQFFALVSSEKAQGYWEKLVPLRANIVGEDSSHLDDLGLIFEEGKSSSKGFAGEKIAEIKSKLTQPNLTEWELREFLNKCETEVAKRIWPGGKQAIWEQLILVWKTMDRNKALVLTAKLSHALRGALVRRMNQERPLSVEEWRSLIDANSQNEAVKIVLAILDDPQPQLTLPNTLVVPVLKTISSHLTYINQLQGVLDKIKKFVPMVANNETWTDLFESVKETARNFATSGVFGNQWAERFNAILSLMITGISTGVITDENVPKLGINFPKHILDFATTCCYAFLTGETNASEYLEKTLASVSQKVESEAWFLVLITQRGFGEIAYRLAQDSTRRSELLPRIRRAWLCNNSQVASAHIDPVEIENDPVAQILFQSPGQERVEYLRKISENGRTSLPGGLWAAEIQEEEKGFWTKFWSGGKTIDQITDEYLKRNPLYNSYKVTTPPAQQFMEYLRFSGYGEYSCEFLDPILLEILIHWADQSPEEVRSLLKNMWRAIIPDENILKLDFLRNAIFSRCTTVFAANPEVLAEDFLPWLKATLVDRAIIWQVGKTQYTVRYPVTALASMCLQGALAVQGISPARRDKLVELALTRYPSDDNIAQVCAQLYNTGKVPLDIELPWKTMSKINDSWQEGIVRNAIPSLFQEIVALQVSPDA